MPPLIVLNQRRSVADDILLTAAVRDLHEVVPEARLQVNSTHPEIWANNRLISVYEPSDEMQSIEVNYDAGRRIACDPHLPSTHALLWGYRTIEEALGFEIPCRAPKPDLWLTEEERAYPPANDSYWLLWTSTQRTLSTTAWPTVYWQEVVTFLKDSGVTPVQVGNRDDIFAAPPLVGAIDLCNRLSTRDLLKFLHFSRGVVTPPGWIMHAAAAFDKPCVVLGGNHSPESWNAYNHKGLGPLAIHLSQPHTYLTALGDPEPCMQTVCTIKTFGDGGCVLPVHCDSPVASQTVSTCQKRIKPAQVIEALRPSLGMQSPVPVKKKVRTLVRRVDRTTTSLEDYRKKDPPGEPADHPIIGGKITVCVLVYGPYAQLARRCLQSILDNTPERWLDLRIWANVACSETKGYLESIQDRCRKIYYNDDSKSAVKYPAMRKMFRDPECPLETNYVMWFDDDSYVDHADWLHYVTRTIVRLHPSGHRLFGQKLAHPCKGDAEVRPAARSWPPMSQVEYDRRAQKRRSVTNFWYESRPWYQGVPYRNSKEQPTPNGTKTFFVHGGWWVIARETIFEADIPDDTLWHNGGDITIGEQVNQAGYKVADLNAGHGIIKIGKHVRRGYSERAPWLAYAKEKGIIP